MVSYRGWLYNPLVKFDAKLGAAALFAFDLDVPVLARDDAVRHRQADAYTALACTASAVKPLENIRQILLRNALPAIGDDDFREQGVFPICNRDRALFRRMLNRIFKNINDRFGGPIEIACQCSGAV